MPNRKNPLKYLIFINLFFSTVLLTIAFLPIPYGLNYFQELINIKYTFLWLLILSPLLIAVPKDFNFYFYLFINFGNFFYTIFSLHRTEGVFFRKNFIDPLIILNSFNILICFYFFYPLFLHYLKKYVPKLDMPPTFNFYPNLATIVLNYQTNPLPVVLAHLNIPKSYLIWNKLIEMDEEVQLRVSYNGYQVSLKGQISEKLTYKNHNIVSISLKFENIIDYIIFRIISNQIEIKQ